MTLFDLPVYEVIVRFQGGNLMEITATFYARGDVGNLSKEKYHTLVETATGAVSKFSGAKATPRGKDPKNAVKADGVFWLTDKGRYLLEFSSTKEVKSRDIQFRAEFVRLKFLPPDKKASLAKSAAAQQGGKFTGAAHVKRDATSGDVYLGDVPMVDQGQKGYCVVASTERVLRYYGNQVDANELAQIANSSADGGTSLTAMHAALKKIAARLKVRVRELEGQDVKGILALVKDYNRAAKRANEQEIPDPGYSIDIGRIYSAMDFDVLKEARTRNKADLLKFERTVRSHIDAGIPLLWSVELGLCEEPGIPQSAGGHMRLIIGYNTTKQEIIFSDSWGEGHELKRMPAADAWTITTGLTKIEPIP